MNNQNSILLLDPTFDPKTSINCNLLVKLGINSFSYAIIDKEKNKVVAVYDEQECDDVPTKLRERLKNDSYLALTFSEVKIAVYSENTISLPHAIFNDDQLELATSFFSPSHSENLYTNTHPNFGLNSVFSFSKITDELIHQSLATSKKYHPNDGLLKLAEHVEDTALLLDFTAGSLHLLYLKDKCVIFQHGYEIENQEELNYYILLLIHQLKIDPHHTIVYISGIIHEGDEKYNLLKQYFDTLTFLNLPNSGLDQQVLDDMPTHYYTSLLTLDQCV